VREHSCDAVVEIWECAASMRKDDFTVPARGEWVGEEHVDCCTTGLVRTVEHGLREVAIYEVVVDGVGRVDEDYSFPAIQLLPDGTKVFMH
jgi:hypothetical protein